MDPRGPGPDSGHNILDGGPDRGPLEGRERVAKVHVNDGNGLAGGVSRMPFDRVAAEELGLEVIEVNAGSLARSGLALSKLVGEARAWTSTSTGRVPSSAGSTTEPGASSGRFRG
jgi:hypothetical protein